MKKRIITIIAIVLAVACLVGVLTACNSASKGVKFKKAEFSVDYTAPAVFTSSNVSELSAFVGYNVYDREGSLVVFSKWSDSADANVYTLYNLAANSAIVSDTTDTFALYSFEENSFYTRSSYDKVAMKYTTTLYNINGEAIKYIDADGAEQTNFVAEYCPEVDDEEADIWEYLDCYYRVDPYGTGISLIKRVSDMSSYDYDFDYSNDNYYYEFTGSGIFIFNKSLDLVTSYYYESNDGKNGPFVLESGDVVFQYSYQQPDTSKDYTYVSGGKKYLLKTFVLEAKDGDVSKKSVDFVISDLNANDVNAKHGSVTISDSVENVALIYPIEDERLMNAYGDRMRVSLSNKLKIKGRFDKMIDNQKPGSFIENIINDKLVFSTLTSNKLVTASGEVIGDFKFEEFNNSFIKRNGKLYDFNLKMVCDYEAEGYSFYKMLNNNVIFRKYEEAGTDYYLYNGTEFTKLTTDTAAVKVEFMTDFSGKYIFALKSTDKSTYKVAYSYYNEKNEAISGLPTTTLIGSVTSDAEKELFLYGAMIQNTTSGDYEYHYYRIAK